MLGGHMSHPVQVHEPVDQRQQQGSGRPEYRFAWNDMAKIEPLSGREFWEAQQTTSQVTHKLTLRWRPRRLTSRHQIVFEGRIFRISSVIDIGEKHRFWLAMCVEAA